MGRLIPLVSMLRPSAQLLCRMSVVFICAFVAVLRPTTRLAGHYTFLILTTKVCGVENALSNRRDVLQDIVFPPSTNPSAQIEALGNVGFLDRDRVG